MFKGMLLTGWISGGTDGAQRLGSSFFNSTKLSV